MSVVLRCSVRLVRLVSPGTFARRSGCGLAVTARVLCGRLHADPCRASQVWRLGRIGGAIAMVGQQHPPAGWYPDPAGGGGRRYWDGGQWAAVAPPAGWYPDPDGSGGRRYWNGRQWAAVAKPAKPPRRDPGTSTPMPDPADGEGRRDDDIDQREPPAPAATPAGRPSRARRWVWATLAVVAGLAVAGVVTGVWLVERSTPSAGEYGDAVDALALPPEFTLISETEYGNALCLDECLRLDRRYSSPSSLDDTFQIVYDALRAAGYQCESPCRYFGV